MDRWQRFLHDLPDDRVTDGNRAEHIAEDRKILPAVWDALDRAEESIWMSMYTIGADEVGRGTLHRMAEAARRECDVRLIYDHFGSFNLEKRDLEPLRRAGVQVAVFNPFWPPWKKRGSTIVRNHRKLTIIDGREAFCGGFNFAEGYASRAFGPWTFDDTMARVEGPCVRDLASVFAHTWRELTGEDLSLPPRRDPFPEGYTTAVLELDPRRDQTQLISTLAGAIRQAQSHCYFATPYFTPPLPLYEALLEATRKGVDVRILTAGETDRPPARLAGWHCYGMFIQNGARIFEKFGRIQHSKTVTIDGQFGSIGSFNMDAWTSRHTLDLNLVFASEEIATALEEEFFEDLEEDPREITQEDCERRSPLQRLGHQITYHAYCNL